MDDPKVICVKRLTDGCGLEETSVEIEPTKFRGKRTNNQEQ